MSARPRSACRAAANGPAGVSGCDWRPMARSMRAGSASRSSVKMGIDVGTRQIRLVVVQQRIVGSATQRFGQRRGLLAGERDDDLQLTRHGVPVVLGSGRAPRLLAGGGGLGERHHQRGGHGPGLAPSAANQFDVGGPPGIETLAGRNSGQLADLRCRGQVVNQPGQSRQGFGANAPRRRRASSRPRPRTASPKAWLRSPICLALSCRAA